MPLRDNVIYRRIAGLPNSGQKLGMACIVEATNGVILAARVLYIERDTTSFQRDLVLQTATSIAPAAHLCPLRA